MAGSTPTTSSSGSALDPTQQQMIQEMKDMADQQAKFSVKMAHAHQDLDAGKQVNNQ
jgi:hypothetical protein